MTPRRKKVFVTLFPNPLFQNFHLLKDTAQLAYRFSSLFGYSSKIVSYENGTYPYQEYTPSLVLEFLKKRRSPKFIDISAILYVIKNARRIDILHMMFFDFNTVLIAYLYKVLNPGGFFYVRLDFHPDAPFSDSHWFKTVRKPHILIKNFLQRRFLRSVDLWSIQDEDAEAYLEKKYPFFNGRLALSYNGVAIDVIQSLRIPVRQFSQKENIIFTAGRIGDWQKATEVLLEAFALLPKDHGWALHLAGPIEPSFQSNLDSFFVRHPDLKSRIVFHGNIREKAALYDLYNRAKIFCLTSRYEGMALVVPEAMYFKNAIITTRVGGYRISISGGKTGRIVEKDQPEQVAAVLRECISDPAWLERAGEEAHRIAVEVLDWDVIARKLHTVMDAHGLQ